MIRAETRHMHTCGGHAMLEAPRQSWNCSAWSYIAAMEMVPTAMQCSTGSALVHAMQTACT